MGAGLLFAAVITPCQAAQSMDEQAERDAPSLPRFKAESGDLDLTMRHRLRILVPYSKTLFFVDRGKQYGTVADLGRVLEAWINRNHKARAKRITVDLVPVARDQLLPALIAGQGDIAAGNLAITEDRLVQVDFAEPWMTGVNEVVVTGPSAPELGSLDDLAGAEIYVRRSSSYAAHIAVLNEKLTARALDPITVIPADENLEDEDLMEMVNAGLLPMTVVDDHEAELWARILPNLRVRSDLAVSTGSKVGWAVRKDSGNLRDMLDTFFKTHKEGGARATAVEKRYFKTVRFVTNAFAEDSVRRFEQVLDLFRRYGDQYGFDYLMIAAQGYQESQLDQSRRSPQGAVGIMQLMPGTAADPSVGVDGIDIDADRNIEAGTKYLRYLIDTYLDDPAIDVKNRTLMGFAAYNAGPGNLAKFRSAAAQSGLNPNVWFDNVENGAARVVGRETVQYVSNIYKYYVAYELLLERQNGTLDARPRPNP